MKKSNKPKRILLAVDLKANDLTLTERVWEALKPMTQEEGVVVEPVAILNREDAAIGHILRSPIGKLSKAAERHLGEQLESRGMRGMACPKILFADGSSTQRAVTALLQYAKRTRCDLIAVSSHSRKGLNRLFLGSFAETLSLQSPIPLLVVNPLLKATPAAAKTILFPTDFSEKAKAGLEMVCRSFHSHQPKIVLFHSCALPSQVFLEPFAAYPIPQSVLDEEFAETERQAHQWRQEVRKLGLSCEVILDRRTMVVTEAILRAAKQSKAGTIAMVSNSGKIGAIFLGSVVREILRTSPLPVWVVHPKKKSAPVAANRRSEREPRAAA